MDAHARKQRAITSDRVDPNKPASIVIGKFGGLTRFCELTGFKTSTAHHWTVSSGYVPSKHHAHILAKAAEHRIKLKAADFVERPANDQDSPQDPPGQGDSTAAASPPGEGLPPPAAAVQPFPADAISDA